jgi:hypothetical protein
MSAIKIVDESLAVVQPEPEVDLSKDLSEATDTVDVVETAPTKSRDDDKMNSGSTKSINSDKIDEVAESVGAGPDENASPAPPPKPPRPLSPFAQAYATLKEAFPNTDVGIIRAVLVASQYDLDRAFSALLSMNDPDFKPELPPRRPSEQEQQRQMEEDEALARQLAEEDGNHRRPSHSSSRRVRTGASGYSGRYDDAGPTEPERSFFDDDLPEIKESFQKGFNETKVKVSSWMTNLRKKIDGEEGQPGIFGALGGTGTPRSSNDEYRRRSTERPSGDGRHGHDKYYDRDPAEIADDFRGISLRDDVDGADAPAKPPRPNRPRAVSALGDESPMVESKGTTVGAKWEPLKSVPPEPESDKDPFFIGDSDEEEEELKVKK